MTLSALLVLASLYFVNLPKVIRKTPPLTARVFDLLDGVMPELAWLDDNETLTYLHGTVSTRCLQWRYRRHRSILTLYWPTAP